ncbi:MAG: DUF1641 domain-containing protein [SAR324 cluster bacterium]|nr:DUF1641 domain-containing protein [SAR324 cluster bacterium]
MENEKLILEKIGNIEEQLAFLVKPAQRNQELKDDIMPLMNHGVGLLINELLDVGSSFELNDLFELIKQFMRSTHNLQYSLKQLDNIIEFIQDVEPLLRSAVPQLIHYLDDLEKRGVLRIIKSALDVRAKIAKTYSPEDIDAIGDGFVSLLGFAKNLADPKVLKILELFLSVPAKVDLEDCKPVGPLGLLLAGADKDIHNTNGVMLKLTKALGKSIAEG